ncbi:MAG: PIN domain nuclease [Proteobacteria bacterium]|nr:PIN domain nuclease [Desulfobacteraceae bacterium]MBU4012396.1 PIN domain nuclease [Pseudomonadota bacterium]MBU4068482.1 PIN domain nuclease [Pseudomonadota bacterium]MBU4100549.1 PIN domain nuclease [Pseudomonadota bacterium]MBU4127487.1 PIN domain nuclease [Pseudomonadota bacterium]
MILVDSSVWIDYFNGLGNRQTDLLDDMLSNVPILIGDLILAEVLQGFRSDDDFEAAKTGLSILQFREIGGYEIALQSAQNYRLLRKKGVTVRKTIDVIIGTFCISEGITLLHNDRDFEPMVSHLSLKVLTPE